VEAKEAYDDWWRQIELCRNYSNPSGEDCHYNKINWPIVDSIGWWDLFQHTQLTHFKSIRAWSDKSVRDRHVLIAGPLGHCIGGASPLDQPVFAAEEANGLVVAAEVASEIFKGSFNGTTINGSQVSRVNLFVMGSFHNDGLLHSGNYWTSLDEFPEPEPTKFFLGASGSLEKQPPTAAALRKYVYDPSAEEGATPMFGGNNLPGIGAIPVCGSADQMPKANRSDILIFDSEPLSSDTPVVGDFSAQLWVGSSAKDTDFFVTVEDLGPLKQKSMLVRYGMARMRWRDSDVVMSPPLEADQVYPIEIGLWSSAYIFPKGHHVRVTVSSAAYPYYDANPNTGSPLFTPGEQPVAATNAVHIAPEYPSSVSLPIVSAADVPKNPKFVPRIPTNTAVV
jgi:putative CocE/NonD family hydrolase